MLVLSQYVELGLAMQLLERLAPRASATCSRTASPTSPSSPTPSAGSAAGGSALDPTIVSQLLSRAATPDPLDELTPREREVLELMAEGRSNQGIAERLEITERGVQKHVTSIFAKLGLPPTTDDHRRVLAVLAFLRANAHGVNQDAPRHAGRPAFRARRRGWDRALMHTITIPTSSRDDRPRSSRRPASRAATARATPPSTRCAASSLDDRRAAS